MAAHRTLITILAFLFVATWGAASIVTALLALLAALVVWAIVGVLGGELDLGDVQARVDRRRVR